MGGRIAQFRYVVGLTPKEFGKLVGADPSTVRAWEANINLPHKNRITQIQSVINIINRF